MRISAKSVCASVVCAAFLAAAPAWAGTVGVGAPAMGASEANISLVKEYHPPAGKQCIKWTRRFHSSLGMGHRRCVHWK